MIYKPLLVRVLITIIVLVCNDLWKTNVVFFFFLMVTLDQIDCWAVKFYKSQKAEGNKLHDFIKQKCEGDFDYQKYDKVGDIIFYMLVIGLGDFDSETKKLLYALTLYRSIGVYKFYNDKNTILRNYVDGINSTIIVSFLAKKFPIVKDNYYLSIIVGFLVKYKYETMHNNTVYNKSSICDLSPLQTFLLAIVS